MYTQQAPRQWPAPSEWDWGSGTRRAGALALVLVLVLGLLGVAVPALAQECGCTDTGAYKNAAVKLAAKGELSPGGKYRLVTSQTATEATLRVELAATGALVEQFTRSLTRLDWGFSPDGERFMYRSAVATFTDGVGVWDLAADRSVFYDDTVASGAGFSFSPHGRWTYVNQLTAPGTGRITVRDAFAGTAALDTTFTFESAPGDPGDTHGVMNSGFSSEAEDRSFVWAYRKAGGEIQLQVRNLQARTTVVNRGVATPSWWQFSPCGDVLGLVEQPGTSGIEVSLHKTAGGGQLGTTRAFSPVPDQTKLQSTADQHQVVNVKGGVSTTTNLAANGAGQPCAPALALDAVTVDPTTVVGGQANATGTVRLNTAAPSAVTVNLTSSDPGAATVPASVSVSAGATSRTFTVTSKTVTEPRNVTITASYGGTQKTAALTVQPKPAGPKVSDLTLESARAMGGATARATVTLDQPAPSGGLAVALSSSVTSVATVASSVTVPAGATETGFDIATSEVAGDSPVEITAAAGGSTRSVRLTVLTADRGCDAGSSDEAAQTMGARAFAAYDDQGAGVDCFQNPVLSNGITVGPGTTGLAPGTPVELAFTARLTGFVHTSPPLGSGGALAEGIVSYDVYDDSVATPEGLYQVVGFRSQNQLDQHQLYATGPNTYWDSYSTLSTNVGDPQEVLDGSEDRSGGGVTRRIDSGALTAVFQTTVGAHLTIDARLTAGASAYGTGSSGVAHLRDGFYASTVPAPGYEGLELVLDSDGGGANLPPVCSDSNLETPEDTALEGTVDCQDPDLDPLAYTVLGGPEHGTLSAIGPGGEFTYTPAENYFGPDSFTVQASDGSALSAPATVRIEVTPVNDGVICIGDAVEVRQDVPVEIRVECSDGDGDPLAYVLKKAPAGGSVSEIAADGSFTYTPAAGFTGKDALSIKATDGHGGAARARFVIQVLPYRPGAPATKEDCRQGGWKAYLDVNPAFARQADCLEYVKAL